MSKDYDAGAASAMYAAGYGDGYTSVRNAILADEGKAVPGYVNPGASWHYSYRTGWDAGYKDAHAYNREAPAFFKSDQPGYQT